MAQNKVPFHIWEGIFDDFKSAGGFDESFRHPIWYQNLQERTQKLLTQYNKDRRIPSYPVAHEYPLTTLAALAAHPARTLRILDFGGAMGHDFLAVAASLPENQPLDYVVVELPEIVEKANTIFLIQPFQNFAKNLEKPEDINDWDIMDWWNLPQRFRWEYLQNLGAMKALVDHIQSRRIQPSSRFSDRIILAGGSAGAPVPAMITGFYPEKISGLMIIFGFTNIVAVIKNEIYRQGLIRLKITESDEGFQVLLQRSILKILGSIFSVILGNMLKYGEIELYLQEVQNTPIHFINGSRDHLISDETYLPMWENTPEPKSEMWLEGGHIDPSNPEEVKRIMNLMDEWTESQNLRECQN